ncbi:hypothetical protein D3C72_1458460 [compost metagenome]
MQIRFGEFSVQESHVELPRLQALEQVGAQVDVRLQRDAGVVRAQQADQGGQPGHRRDLGDAETEGAGQRVLALQADQQAVAVAQHLFGQGIHLVAARGQFGAVAGAVEEGHVEVRLQFLDALGDGRLRGVQLLRRRGKRAQAHRPVQGFDLFESQHAAGLPRVRFIPKFL